jgi:hypothetical protein
MIARKTVGTSNRSTDRKDEVRSPHLRCSLQKDHAYVGSFEHYRTGLSFSRGEKFHDARIFFMRQVPALLLRHFAADHQSRELIRKVSCIEHAAEGNFGRFKSRCDEPPLLQMGDQLFQLRLAERGFSVLLRY